MRIEGNRILIRSSTNQAVNSSKQDAHGIIQPITKDGRGATDTGPRDLQVDGQNPDILTPPSTDRGTIPNLK
jgi:hypothetical protein